MVTPSALIANHVGQYVPLDGIEVVEETCCVTGVLCPCVPVNLLITSSFTDGKFFKNPSGRWVGVDIYKAWKYGILEAGKKRQFAPERMSCWVVSETSFEFRIDRKRIREVALEGCKPPWACWVTTGYKKHGSIRAKVNIRHRGVIAFDELRVDCSDPRIDDFYFRLTEMQKKGFSRPTLETLNCPPAVLKKLDFTEWMRFCEWAKAWYTSPTYQFCCYLLPSKEELKK